MNLIEKLIDSHLIADQSGNRSEMPLFNIPDLRSWSDSLIGSSVGTFNGNLFPITQNQPLRSQKMPSSNCSDLHFGKTTKDDENERTFEDEHSCETCEETFANKYYLKKHNIEVHKLDFSIDNSTENFQLFNDFSQKSPLFRPPIFNSLFNSSFSNFFLQKSIAPIFANILSSQSSLPHSTQVGSDIDPIQSGFKTIQTPSTLKSVDILTPCQSSFQSLPLTNNEIKISNPSNPNFIDRNSFIKVPSESKPFLHLNLLDQSFRDPNKNMSQQMTCTICGLQLTGGESVLLDHLYTYHSLDKSSNHSPVFKNPPTKDSPGSPATASESYISPFDAFKSSMAAAKLADRVTCEICHKDLCNKYFLRTHKLKLHGIQTMDPSGRSGNRKEKLGFYEGCSTQIDQVNVSPKFITPPFQRTSLQDSILAASSYHNTVRDKSFSSEGGCFCPICKRLVPLPYFLPLHMWNVHGIGIGGTNSFLPTVPIARPNVNETSLDQSFLPSFQSKINQALFPLPLGSNGGDGSSIGSKWYRKSPNQMRVRCDICDKWICNKYFLRTHKLNKHGITDSGSNTDINSDSISRGFFMDSTNPISNTSVTMDHLACQDNVFNSSPLDLSASQNQDSPESKYNNQATTNFNKNIFSKFSCKSLLSDLDVRSMLNPRMGSNWPVGDLGNNFGISTYNANSNNPLDLSFKSNKNDNGRQVLLNGLRRKVKSSLIVYSAKKLKIKYQNIFRRQLLQRTQIVDRRSLLNINASQCPSSESFSCPLCGKQLQDAPRFIHHLTQFHDMVLPGHHSGSEDPLRLL